MHLIIPFNFFNNPISVQNITKNASITQDIPEITFESPSSHFVPLSEQKQTEISVSPDYLSQENTYNNNTSTEDFSTEAKVTTTSSQPQQAISLAQTTGTSAFATDLYCEKTGNYLLWRSEDVTRDVTFTGGTMLNNGDVELSYYDTYATEYKGIVTLRKENDTWKFLSNRSADGKAHY